MVKFSQDGPYTIWMDDKWYILSYGNKVLTLTDNLQDILVKIKKLKKENL